MLSMAGHISSVPEPLPGKALPVWLHQGLADKRVFADGCCGAHPCCCGIISTPVCSGAEDHFEWWLQRNRCNGRENISFPEEPSAQCHRGVGCAAETRLCLFEGFGHSQFLASAVLGTEALSVLLGRGDVLDVLRPDLPMIPKATCTDNAADCPGWASIGECTKNPDYMSVNCRMSCQLCNQVNVSAIQQNYIVPDSLLEPILAKMEEPQEDGEMKPYHLFATALLLVALSLLLALWRHRSGAPGCCSSHHFVRLSEEDQPLYNVAEVESK